MTVLRKFGVEMECFHPTHSSSTSHRNLPVAIRAMGFQSVGANYSGRDYDVWQVKPDGSLRRSARDDDGGIEIVAPTLPATQASFDQITKVANYLGANGYDVNVYCGMHIHIDAADLTLQEASAVALRYHHCQSQIDEIMARSRRGGTWSNRLDSGALRKVVEAVTASNARVVWGHHERRVAVNLEHVHKGRSDKRIEFRQHQGTLNAAKILGWYKFLCGFVAETVRLVRQGGNLAQPTAVVPVPHAVPALVRRQRTRRGTTRSVVVGTTPPTIPQIDVGTDYDLFLNRMANEGVVTQQDARSFGWPETRLRVTAHWLRRHGAELITTQRNGELAYVGGNGARTRAEIFANPAQIRQRIEAAPLASATFSTIAATAPQRAAGRDLADLLTRTNALDGLDDETKAWFNIRRSEIAAASAGRP
jgi:hypothetical protein